MIQAYEYNHAWVGALVVVRGHIAPSSWQLGGGQVGGTPCPPLAPPMAVSDTSGCEHGSSTQIVYTIVTCRPMYTFSPQQLAFTITRYRLNHSRTIVHQHNATPTTPHYANVDHNARIVYARLPRRPGVDVAPTVSWDIGSTLVTQCQCYTRLVEPISYRELRQSCRKLL